MSEAVALAPEEPLVAPAPVPVPEVPAEGSEPAQTAEPATAPVEKPEEKPTSDPTEKRSQSRLQRRIDAATRKMYEAQARADFLEKQLAERTPKPPVEGAPRMEQFSDIEEYGKAVDKYAREQAIKEYEANQRNQTAKQMQDALRAEWAKKAEEGSEKYEDFDQVVGELTPATPWSAAIMEAENAADIAYYLGKHPAEVRAIMNLTPVGQIRAIGKLEAKLMSEPAKPKTPSQAPAPIAPVGGKSGGASDMPLDSDDINTWMEKSLALDRKRRGRA